MPRASCPLVYRRRMSVEPIRFLGDKLQLLDQRRLPREVIWVDCHDAHEVAVAIRDRIVRGAPAIGVAAAYGVALAAKRGDDVRAAAEELRAARPTAVNLAWAVDRMLNANGDLVAEARRMHDEDVEANRRIGRNGALLLDERSTVLTHCNAGALATAGYGTALGVIRAAIEAGKQIDVFADETRPFLQGARLTVWELQQDGIPTTLITDNMAGHFMKTGRIGCVVVGADRIAANGDVANKVGTYPVAVLARENGVPFFVAAPISTLDLALESGDQIPIEERSAGEVTHVFGHLVPPSGPPAMNPAFDVTPARYVTAIITEKGVARAPYEESLKGLAVPSRK